MIVVEPNGRGVVKNDPCCIILQVGDGSYFSVGYFGNYTKHVYILRLFPVEKVEAAVRRNAPYIARSTDAHVVDAV